jgi:hypothetical protein
MCDATPEAVFEAVMEGRHIERRGQDIPSMFNEDAIKYFKAHRAEIL